jgi:hypothetical protein
MSNGVVQISPFISMMVGLLFTFSTIYGLMYYFNQGESQQIQLVALGENGNNPNSVNQSTGYIGSFVSGSIDALLSFISWVSPFALIRGAILAISPPDLFQVLDIFILRPISWCVSILTANWILSAIRGKSEGT